MATWKSHKCSLCCYHSLQWNRLRRKQKGCVYKSTRAAIRRCLSLHGVYHGGTFAHSLWDSTWVTECLYPRMTDNRLSPYLAWSLNCQSLAFLFLSTRTSTLLDKASIITTWFYHNSLLFSKLFWQLSITPFCKYPKFSLTVLSLKNI